ncbi:MAG: hypothetical protein RBS80_11355 [Thermoguttaceae bacterium]|nr:hypothetical protein [Thermoguttaceae bacterium]
MRQYTLPLMLLLMGGCQFLPEITHQPTVYNPFPQLSRVAVVPFFNMTDEPTLNGEQVAWAYFTELQSVPGFEVVPVATVQEVIDRNRLQLASADDVRQLAQLLEVDAVVVGAITDYKPYYPPRFGLQVRWYSANPCFHPIPPGYGLPWGTPGEQHIPAPLVFEAEMALARAQMKTQTPTYQREQGTSGQDVEIPRFDPLDGDQPDGQTPERPSGVQHLSHEQILAERNERLPETAGPPRGLPPDWPDPRGFVPPSPRIRPPSCPSPSSDPVLQHTAVYVGNDPNVTEALASYFYFRNDRRFGGWQGYLQRSDDYIRFCCHMHISEMLSARGGAGETRVVWRWPTNR